MRIFQDDEGFTIIETLVSFIIFSGALALAFEVTGNGIVALQRATEKAAFEAAVSAEVEQRIHLGGIIRGVTAIQSKGRNWAIVAAPVPSEGSPGFMHEPWIVTARDEGGAILYQTITLLNRPQ